jgi:hypothetical protein
MNRPLVSVIIPTHNSGRFITHAIESVLAQSYDNYEVIVVDDGSTDGTRNRVNAYGGRVRYVEYARRGIGAARNHGARLARGEWLAFLDAEDFWYPQKLESQLALADAHPSLDFITGNYHNIEENGRLVNQAFDDNPVVGYESSESGRWAVVFDAQNAERYVQHPFGALSTTLVRPDLFWFVGGFNERVHAAEDIHLMVRLAAMCRSFGTVRPPVAANRAQSGRRSRRPDEQALRPKLHALRDLLRCGYLTLPMSRAVRTQIVETELALAQLLARQGQRASATVEASRAFLTQPTMGNLRSLVWINRAQDVEPESDLDDLVDPVELFLFGAVA